MTKLLTPFFVAGKVVKGFGRGSKQLGIPTANIDTNVVQNISLENGIYFGFCQLFTPKETNGYQNGSTPVSTTNGPNSSDGREQSPPILAMVCSLGWNPQFNNTIRSLEVHILSKFEADFYGSSLRVAICGYIRNEQKFDSMNQLIQTIHNDINIAKQALEDRNQWSEVISNEFFKH